MIKADMLMFSSNTGRCSTSLPLLRSSGSIDTLDEFLENVRRITRKIHTNSYAEYHSDNWKLQWQYTWSKLDPFCSKFGSHLPFWFVICKKYDFYWKSRLNHVHSNLAADTDGLTLLCKLVPKSQLVSNCSHTVPSVKWRFHKSLTSRVSGSRLRVSGGFHIHVTISRHDYNTVEL